TIVYLFPSNHIRPPLPTEEAADAIWREVTDDQAWRRKFARGLSRFNLSLSYTPRCLSEVNLAVERGTVRRWFLLGGQGNVGRPRFDVRLFRNSPTFWVQDLSTEFARTGGVVIWPNRDGLAPPAFGEPVKHFPAVREGGVSIYCSSDLRQG